MSIDAARSGYRLLLPPGWARLDLTDDVDAQVRRLLEAALRGRAPDDAAAFRRQLGAQMSASAQEAAARGVAVLYFPVAEEAGAPLPTSIAVAALTGDRLDDPLDLLVAMAARDSSGRAVDLDGAVALRTSRLTRSTALDSEEVPEEDRALVSALVRRQVQYIVGDPTDRGRWLTFTWVCVVPGDGSANEVADAAEELFDAMMLSFRWTER